MGERGPERPASKEPREHRPHPQLLVTKGKISARPAALSVEGHGLGIANEDKSPSPFDHSDVGTLGSKKSKSRQFFLVNEGDQELRLDKKNRITIEGQ